MKASSPRLSRFRWGLFPFFSGRETDLSTPGREPPHHRVRLLVFTRFLDPVGNVKVGGSCSSVSTYAEFLVRRRFIG